MIVTVGSFMACTSESLDDPAAANGAVSIVFSVGDTRTKAVANDYTYATDKEITINSFHIALFNADGTTRIATSDVTSPTPLTDASVVGGKQYYQTSFSNISSLDYPDVKVVIVANYKDKKDKKGNALDFSNCTTLASYGTVVESATTNFSDTTNLMKVGIASGSLSVGGPNRIIVPLTQLTARIDFGGITVADTKVATKATTIDESSITYTYLNDTAAGNNLAPLQAVVASDPNVNQYSDITWSNYNTWWENGLPYGGYFYKVYDFYYYSRVILVKKVYQQTTDLESASSTSSFVVTNATYNGTNLSSDISIFDNTKIENTQINYAGSGLGTVPFVFYTYERKASTSNPLKMTIKGYFNTAATQQTSTVTEYGYMIQTRPSGGWSSTAPTSSQLAAAATTFVPVSSLTTTVVTGNNEKSSAEKTYTLNLGAYDFVKGNCYKISGTVLPSYDETIYWQVVNWTTGKDITIPSFE